VGENAAADKAGEIESSEEKTRTRAREISRHITKEMTTTKASLNYRLISSMWRVCIGLRYNNRHSGHSVPSCDWRPSQVFKFALWC